MATEFGRGYATCLRQFVNHRARLQEYLGSYEKMRKKGPGKFTLTQEEIDKAFSDSEAAWLWMNGASDHLYELIRPLRGLPKEEWETARRLKDRCLDIGHGFVERPRATVAEVVELLGIADHLLNRMLSRGLDCSTLDRAMVSDGVLGLSPDSGGFECSEDIARSGI